MSEITRILTAIDQGDTRASDELLPLVYEELRRLAARRLSHEKPGQTLSCRDKRVTSGFETGYLDETGLMSSRRCKSSLGKG